jgi:hypothetical protein
MCGIVREDEMRNISQNIDNIEYKFEDDAALQMTKLSN